MVGRPAGRARERGLPPCDSDGTGLEQTMAANTRRDPPEKTQRDTPGTTAPSRDAGIEAPPSVTGGDRDAGDVERETADSATTDAAAPDGSAVSEREREEPPDEGPIESLGRSVGDVVTGSVEANDGGRDTPARTP
jgi:hypothetical protein